MVDSDFFCVRWGEPEEELMRWCGVLQDVTSSSVWIDGVLWLGRRPGRPAACGISQPGELKFSQGRFRQQTKFFIFIVEGGYKCSNNIGCVIDLHVFKFWKA